MNKQIAVIIGSLRKESFNRKIANAVIAMAPKSLQCKIVDIGNLPLYNQDLDDEGKPPVAWTTFRDQIKACNGVLFVTPEYNRSIPGVLKNAIDVGSRPYGKSIWEKKPSAVISASISAIGGFGANHHLRQTFVFLDMPILQQPECYIGNVDKILGNKGEITNASTKEFLEKFINAFAEWVGKL